MRQDTVFSETFVISRGRTTYSDWNDKLSSGFCTCQLSSVASSPVSMFLVPPLPQNRTLAPGRLGEDEMANNDKGQRLATGHCMHGGDLVFYTALGILQTQEDRVG